MQFLTRHSIWLLVMTACGFPEPAHVPGPSDGPADAAPGDGSRGGAGDGGGSDTSNDPPTVLSISPADQAVGVTADTTIVITFSKRMDQAAAQAAFQSSDIPPGSTVMTWNADGTALTVTPNAPLAYANGTDPASVTAKSYALLVTTTAADVNRNHLAKTFMASFHTRRRIQQKITTLRADLSGTCYGNVDVGCGVRIIVGDSADASTYKGLVTFAIAALPPGIRTFESATFKINFDGVEGSPFPSLGLVNVDQATFTSLTMAFAAASRRSFGALQIASNADFGIKGVDALAGIVDDYANRSAFGNVSQYRLSAAVATNNNNTVDIFAFNNPMAELDVTYQAN